MYRVELKEFLVNPTPLPRVEFLMYRVELKAASSKVSALSFQSVPNVPCGVERQFASIENMELWSSCS